MTSVHFTLAYSRTWTQAWSRTIGTLAWVPRTMPFSTLLACRARARRHPFWVSNAARALCLPRRPAPERATAAIRHPLFWGFLAGLDRDPRREDLYVPNIQWQCLNGTVLTSEKDPLLWAEGLGSRRDNGSFSWRPGFWQGQQVACRTAWKRWASWCWRTEETEEPTVFSGHRDFGRSGWTPDPGSAGKSATLQPPPSVSLCHPSISLPSP